MVYQCFSHVTLNLSTIYHKQYITNNISQKHNNSFLISPLYLPYIFPTSLIFHTNFPYLAIWITPSESSHHELTSYNARICRITPTFLIILPPYHNNTKSQKNGNIVFISHILYPISHILYPISHILYNTSYIFQSQCILNHNISPITNKKKPWAAIIS